jgi:AcrR family transcriptional regulator
VDKIVQKASVAKGTFYIYFPSKEDLYQELIEKNIKALIAPKMIQLLKTETDIQILMYKKTILAVHMINKNKLLKELMQDNPNYASGKINCKEIQDLNKKMSVNMFEEIKNSIRPDIEFQDLITISIGIFNLMLSLEDKVEDYWKTIHSLNKIFIDGCFKNPKPWDEKKCWAIINEITN